MHGRLEYLVPMAQKRKRRIPVADLECCLQAEQLHRRSVRRQSHWEDAYQTEIGKLKMEQLGKSVIYIVWVIRGYE